MQVLIAFAMAVALIAGAFPGQKEYGAAAKVSLKAAQQIALRACPGTIITQELEKESGGSGLRYSFDIKRRGIAYEVGVDALTGKVLENDRETGGD